MKKILVVLFVLIGISSFGQISLRCPLCPPSVSGQSGKVLSNNGTALQWVAAGGGGGADTSLTWLKAGNGGTTAGTDFIGTTDAKDFVTKTAGTERMRVLSNGSIGIGTTDPGAFGYVVAQKDTNFYTAISAKNLTNRAAARAMVSAYAYVSNPVNNIGAINMMCNSDSFNDALPAGANWDRRAVISSSGYMYNGMLLYPDDGPFQISVAAHDTPNIYVNPLSRNAVVQTNPGYVGIGIRPANYPLHVHGGLMQITSASTGTTNLDGLVIEAGGAGTTFYNRENTYTSFWNNGAEKFRILATGGSRTIDGVNDAVYHYVENTTNSTASTAGMRFTVGAGLGQMFFCGSSYTGVSGWASSMIWAAYGAGGHKMVGSNVPISFITNSDLTTPSLTLAAGTGTATFAVPVSTTNLIAGNKSINTTAGDASTQNAMAGRFRKDNSGTTFTLTNSFITANSIIVLTPVTAGLTGGKFLTVQAGAGSAVITFEDEATGVATAPSGNMDINFLVVN